MTTPVDVPAKPTTEANPLLGFVSAGILLALAVVNIVFTAMFPANAPVEWALSALITFDLLATGVFLGIWALVVSRRERTIIPLAEKLSIRGLVAAILTLLVAVIWVATAVGSLFGPALAGERLRYMENSGVLALLGLAWDLGVIFAIVSYRRWGGRWNIALSVGSLVLAALVLVPSVLAAVLYGLGLTD